MSKIKIQKKENEFNSQEEKLGFFSKSRLYSLAALIHDGAGMDIIMEMQEKIESFNTTAWSLLALCASGTNISQTDMTIATLDTQLYVTFSELQTMGMTLNELRKKDMLKKAKTTND